MNHQEYIEAVARIGIANLTDDQRANLPAFKLVYGIGMTLVRGMTVYGVWQNGGQDKEHIVEVCAAGEDSPVQLAGTTLHEIGHVLAGYEAGHDTPWHDACQALGLRRLKAAGTYYQPANFAPSVREQIAALGVPTDGRPSFTHQSLAGVDTRPMRFVSMPAPQGFKPRPCGSTHGCRGGQSRGKGSGSRMLKAVCPNEDCQVRDGDKPLTIRITRKWAEHMPTCVCGTQLELED